MVRRVLCPAFKRFFELHERLPLGRRSFSSSWDRWSAVRGCDPHARICFPTKPPASDRLDIFSPTHPCSSPRSSHPSCGARAGPSPPVDDGPSPPPPEPPCRSCPSRIRRLASHSQPPFIFLTPPLAPRIGPCRS